MDQYALFSDSMSGKHLIRIIMPNGDNIGEKNILLMSPIYMTSHSGALCTHFLGRQDFFGS